MASPLRAWRRPLRRLLSAWIRVRRIEPLPGALDLAPDLPTCYVLPRPALSDALLLETLAERSDLPPADALLALPDPRRRRRRPTPPGPDCAAARTATAGRSPPA